MNGLMKPCDNCGKNIQQAILYDDVTCFKTCKKWLKWRKLNAHK